MLNFYNVYSYLILYAVIFVFVIASGYYLEKKPKKEYKVWAASITWTALYVFLTWNELIRIDTNANANGFEMMGWLSVLLLILYLIKNQHKENKQ